MRLALLGLLLTAAVALLPSAPAARAAARPGPVKVAFRGHFGFGRSHSFGFGYGSRYRYGYGYGRPRHSLVHRVVRTAIWLYIAHLFFSHGGLSVLLWIIIIGLVLSLMRRRGRRYTY